MKEYEKAIHDLPEMIDHHYIRPEIEEEVGVWLNDEDVDQAAMHLLKAAVQCLEIWCEDPGFAPAVIGRLKDLKYDNLDFFQKAVLQVLANCSYKDGFFDIHDSHLDYQIGVSDWKKTIEIK